MWTSLITNWRNRSIDASNWRHFVQTLSEQSSGNLFLRPDARVSRCVFMRVYPLTRPWRDYRAAGRLPLEQPGANDDRATRTIPDRHCLRRHSRRYFFFGIRLLKRPIGGVLNQKNSTFMATP